MRCFLVLFAAVGRAPYAIPAESPRVRLMKDCTALIENQTAAFLARDHEQVVKIAQEYISLCRDVQVREDIAGAHADIADAQYELQKYQEALKSSELCLTAHYRLAACHFQKGQALAAVGSSDRALKSLEVAERFAGEAIVDADKKQEGKLEDVDRELLVAKRRQTEGIRDRAKSLRDLILTHKKKARKQ